mgnify:CR=1 FL=1
MSLGAKSNYIPVVYAGTKKKKYKTEAYNSKNVNFYDTLIFVKILIDNQHLMNVSRITRINLAAIGKFVSI